MSPANLTCDPASRRVLKGVELNGHGVNEVLLVIFIDRLLVIPQG